MERLELKRATAADLGQILALFEQTILHVNATDYTPEQQKAWAAGSAKKERWLQKIDEQYFLLAVAQNELLGFASLTKTGYLDFLFVSKDHQRKGVAQTLYNALEQEARAAQLPVMTTDASITAKPFFLKQGFELVQEQTVLIDSVALTNFRMKKTLA